MTVALDALAVMGGNIIEDEGRWRISSHNEGDNFGVTGDNLRVFAAVQLHRQNHSCPIIASGGVGQNRRIAHAPTVAQVIKDKLIELGVPPSLILLETDSNNTFGQLYNIKRLVDRNNFHSLGIVSNFWHLPRIFSLIVMAPGTLRQFLDKVVFFPAEDVLIKSNQAAWTDLITTNYQGEAFKQRLAMESNGIADIMMGRYRFTF